MGPLIYFPLGRRILDIPAGFVLNRYLPGPGRWSPAKRLGIVGGFLGAREAGYRWLEREAFGP